MRWGVENECTCMGTAAHTGMPAAWAYTRLPASMRAGHGKHHATEIYVGMVVRACLTWHDKVAA